MDNTKADAAARARRDRVFGLIQILIPNYTFCFLLMCACHYFELTSWSYLGSGAWYGFAILCVSAQLYWIKSQNGITRQQAIQQGFVGNAYWFILFFWGALMLSEVREIVLFIGVLSLIFLVTFTNLRSSLMITITASLLYLLATYVGQTWLGQNGFSASGFIWLTAFIMIGAVCGMLGGNLERQRLRVSEIKKKQIRQAKDLMIQSEKLASMGQMVASIGHEISNPIMVTQSATSVMEDNLNELESFSLGLFEGSEDDPEAQKVRDEMIQQFGALRSGIAVSMQAASKLKELSHALRTQSRMDTSITEDVNINDVIRESVTMVSGRASLHTIEESLEEMPGIPCMRSRIGQVITNLLANASDALTEKAENSEARFNGKIAISSGPTTRDGAEGISVVITDNGSGVPEEIREKIFDEFFTTKPAGVGTGLGLSMCATIVRDHGGVLEVTDDPTLGGARFAMWLPVSAPEQPQQLH